MKILPLLFLSSTVLAYDQPRVEDPHTVLSKLDHIISLKNTNVSLRGVNDVNLTHKLVGSSRLNFEGYGRYNLTRHDSESGVHFKFKW